MPLMPVGISAHLSEPGKKKQGIPHIQPLGKDSHKQTSVNIDIVTKCRRVDLVSSDWRHFGEATKCQLCSIPETQKLSQQNEQAPEARNTKGLPYQVAGWRVQRFSEYIHMEAA